MFFEITANAVGYRILNHPHSLFSGHNQPEKGITGKKATQTRTGTGQVIGRFNDKATLAALTHKIIEDKSSQRSVFLKNFFTASGRTLTTDVMDISNRTKNKEAFFLFTTDSSRLRIGGSGNNVDIDVLRAHLVVSSSGYRPVWLLSGVFPSAGFLRFAFSGVRGFSWEDVSGRRGGKVHRGRVHFF
ncbi:hypothetical protein FJ875_09655 [Salmonella enterica]|nr:hypothetical protein [Salmonella enterica]